MIELKFSGNVPYDIYCDMTLSFFLLKKSKYHILAIILAKKRRKNAKIV